MESLKYSTEKEIDEKYDSLTAAFKANKTKNIDKRIQQLRILKESFLKHSDEILEADSKDLGLSTFLSGFLNYSTVVGEIDNLIDNLHSWAKPQSVDTPLVLGHASSYVVREPFGTMLIFAAWNGPYVTLIPVIAAAIAAGNNVLAKPSEVGVNAARVNSKILSALDPDFCQVIQGDAQVCIYVLKKRFDFISFTGSTMNGKHVARAAAEHLTPTLLELGGQNPVVIDKTASLKNTAYNIVCGRLLNAGQFCIAPEYAFVQKGLGEDLKQEVLKTYKEFYGDKIEESQDYSRIVNSFHCSRIISDTTETGGKAFISGKSDLDKRFVHPTFIQFSTIEEMKASKLAKDEIFGPIFYFVEYENLSECIEYIKNKEKPLVMYYFGSDKETKTRLLNEVSSGGFVTNDTIIHFSNKYLPFGGVGKSGMGYYHGRWGFDYFSHKRAVMECSKLALPMRYPPFAKNEWLLNFAFRNITISKRKFVNWLGLAVVLAILTIYWSTALRFIQILTNALL